MKKLYNMRPGEQGYYKGDRIIRIQGAIYKAPRGSERKSRPVIGINIDTGMAICHNLVISERDADAAIPNFHYTTVSK